ncbi:unnamed protein product [Trichobilharzia regenti]|nr:unnamed protein product [Trichobilharzia regenti]
MPKPGRYKIIGNQDVTMNNSTRYPPPTDQITTDIGNLNIGSNLIPSSSSACTSLQGSISQSSNSRVI